MDIILKYILLGLAGYFLVILLTKILTHYLKIYSEWSKKKREERKKEKAKWRHSKVGLDNQLFNELYNQRTIIFMGNKGAGKSLMMNVYARFLYEKRSQKNEDNARYNKYMKPQYVRQEEILEQDEKLPIYSNLDFKDYDSCATSQDLTPYLHMDRQAVEKSILCIDEVSSTYGKDLYNDPNVSEEVKKRIKEFTKKNRHYTNGWLLGTEQDGDDIFKGIRENGYVLVQCLQTTVKISKKGKILRRILNTWNLFLPGFLTVNLAKVYREKLFFRDKILLTLKLLLPSYFMLPCSFYTRRQQINDWIKHKYQVYQTRFGYNGQEYYIKFTNNEKFDYNTRAYKDEYDNQFDEKGYRKDKDNEVAYAN